LVETTNSIWLKDMTFSPFYSTKKEQSFYYEQPVYFPILFYDFIVLEIFVSFLKFLFGVPDIFVIVIRFWVTICPV